MYRYRPNLKSIALRVPAQQLNYKNDSITSHRWRISLAVLLVYGRRLPKPEPDPKPGFGGFPNPKPGFGKKAPGLESLVVIDLCIQTACVRFSFTDGSNVDRRDCW